MTRKELDEEIEYIHNNRLEKHLLRPLETVHKVICEATNTYTNLSLFMNDYIGLFVKTLVIDDDTLNRALNDLYLLALLHTTCEEDLEHE